MQQIAKGNIYEIQHKLFELLVLLLMQLLDTIFASNYHCTASKPKAKASTPSQMCPQPAETEQSESRTTKPAKQRRNPTDYAKVELLHRMLVAQQLQQLEQRRLVRLAIERRRLNFELSN